MIIGFTGNQNGMSGKQRKAFYDLIYEFNCREFRHGDCYGSDEDSHNLVVRYFKSCKVRNLFIGRIIIHPPINDSKRAWCRAKTILPAKEYLDRNKDIVNNSDLMIATPKEFEMQLRSGTWSTVRYSLKKNKKTIIIYPDGSLKRENM